MLKGKQNLMVIRLAVKHKRMAFRLEGKHKPMAFMLKAKVIMLKGRH